MREVEKRLGDSLKSYLDSPGKNDPSAWSLAQAVVAANGLIKFDRAQIERFFRKTSKPDCNCWGEIPGGSTDWPNIAISAWVIFALAALDVSATSSELRFLLDNQQGDGWWSVFPVSADPQYASSYATAVAVKALQAQLAKSLTPESLTHDTLASIERGSAWLASNRQKERIRWKNYPKSPDGKVSASISAIVLHTLHVVEPDLGSQFMKSWLDAIPPDVPAANEAEYSSTWIRAKDGDSFLDHTVYLELPWLLIATADAFFSGNLFQRAYALAWLEKALMQDSVVNADTIPDNWWRSELLISIRYVVDQTKDRE